VLVVQHEVARTVAVILVAHVSSAEAERILIKPPATWEAHDYYMRSQSVLTSFMSSLQMADLVEARHLAERSVSLDPRYARPYANLAITYICEWGAFDAHRLDPATLDKAHALARKAVQLDSRVPQLRAVYGATLSWMRCHEEALAEFDKAVALNPNFSEWRHMLALFLASEHARALQVGGAYFRLDPFAPAAPRVWLGAVHYMLGRYAEAVPHLQEAVSRMPNARFAHMWLAATYAQIGKLAPARAEAAEALRIDPGYTIEKTAKLVFGFRLPADTEHFCDGLRKAGLPER
jgi:adenylate cyclase